MSGAGPGGRGAALSPPAAVAPCPRGAPGQSRPPCPGRGAAPPAWPSAAPGSGQRRFPFPLPSTALAPPRPRSFPFTGAARRPPRAAPGAGRGRRRPAGEVWPPLARSRRRRRCPAHLRARRLLLRLVWSAGAGRAPGGPGVAPGRGRGSARSGSCSAAAAAVAPGSPGGTRPSAPESRGETRAGGKLGRQMVPRAGITNSNWKGSGRFKIWSVPKSELRENRGVYLLAALP